MAHWLVKSEPAKYSWDRMVADNLVYRRPDPDDRRRVLLHLAARGRILHQRAAHRVAEDQAALRAALPAGQDELAAPLSPAERHELTRLLTRILDHHT